MACKRAEIGELVPWSFRLASTRTRLAADNKVRANVAFSKLRPWLFDVFQQALFVISISMFSSTVALSGFDEGVANYRLGNYKDAFKEWSEAAQEGNVDAQYNLGCLYVRGEGVSQNEAWAVEWLQRAADQGDFDAATWLLFSNPITDDRRKQYFSRRLKPTDRFRLTFVVQLSDGKIHRRPCSTDEKNGAQIEFSLGVMYETGSAGFPQDDRQAAEWYRRASERNFPDAQMKLAYLYAAGRGVEQSQIEAARLFRRAAEQGNAIAQVNLASVYGHGLLGHAKDLILAYVLVSHAADTGDKLALNNLPGLKALLSPDQLLEGQALVDK
jgi:TPR repeat protein